MENPDIMIHPLFHLGPLAITSTVVTTWVIMAILWLCAWLVSRRLSITPGPLQSAIEGMVVAIESAVSAAAPQHARQIMPLIASLWIFLVIANLCGLIPGVHSPTRDLSATAALAILVFLSTHWYGIRIQGLKPYLKHYLSPSPILLPFHLISEVTRTVALAVRLFGNIMSLEMAALLILLVAGFLAPVPILMLHIIEALVQAYIFGMLALIYVAGGIQSQQSRQARQGDNNA
ncbi:F0F1 ATP synthase subunit A [Porticoccus litoralis]|uniref:ATP synthase subunit a n=1 Tax=Porticoccus litoralis TaxID=434086 RepID=A0AAW8AYJ6_9GAMM|nr:F0F1 ATP synthase subunit A [Porticoccus litoralis]MDP1519885.1 F0F1 ATP synthase subunit A [Porticoccus litoralis]